MTEYVELYRMQKADKAASEAIASAVSSGATAEEAAAAGKEAAEASDLAADPVADEMYLRKINAHLLTPEQIPLAAEAAWVQYKDLNSLYGASGEYYSFCNQLGSYAVAAAEGKLGTRPVRGGTSASSGQRRLGAPHTVSRWGGD